MLSIWEKESFLKYDYIIIGAGIVGLSTAISIKEKKPHSSVLVLERGILPTGASTKNAGFACFGSVSELLAEIRVMGEAQTFEIVKNRWEGLQRLRQRVGDEKMDFRNYGGYELIFENNIELLSEAENINHLLSDYFNEQVFRTCNDKISSFGFNSSKVKGLLFNSLEGQLHTGKMMKRLVELSNQLGVIILTGAEVERLEERGDRVHVEVKNQVNNFWFEGKKIGICTNAFTKKLLKDIPLTPGRGLVLCTKPVSNLKFKGAFHFDQGYFYFRNLGDRVLFGGGRNQDFATEATTAFEINEQILRLLEEYLEEVILPNQEFEVDSVWTGIMAFGPELKPYIRKISSNIFLGVKLSGMGVAIGTEVGEKLAQMMSSEERGMSKEE